MEADWISVATVPMLTMFTCAGEGAGVHTTPHVHRNLTEYNSTRKLGKKNVTLKLNTGETLFIMTELAISKSLQGNIHNLLN